jgi:hypothetical protein
MKDKVGSGSCTLSSLLIDSIRRTMPISAQKDPSCEMRYKPADGTLVRVQARDVIFVE